MNTKWRHRRTIEARTGAVGAAVAPFEAAVGATGANGATTKVAHPLPTRTTTIVTIDRPSRMLPPYLCHFIEDVLFFVIVYINFCYRLYVTNDIYCSI